MFIDLPKDSHKAINLWILYVALPAVSFKYVPYINWNKNLILPVLTPFIIWFGAYSFISIYSKLNNLNNIDKATLILTSGLTNTSFLGFPMVSAYLGENNISIAIILDQINFLVFSSFGLIISISAHEHNKLYFTKIFLKIIKFPPFIGFILAFILPYIIEIKLFEPLIDKLSNTVSPLALFSIGLQLNISEWREQIKNISVGLAYKLLIAPFLIFVFASIIKVQGNIFNVSVLESSMPPLISSYILIDEYKLNSKLANLMIGLGIIISFFTSFIIYKVFIVN